MRNILASNLQLSRFAALWEFALHKIGATSIKIAQVHRFHPMSTTLARLEVNFGQTSLDQLALTLAPVGFRWGQVGPLFSSLSYSLGAGDSRLRDSNVVKLYYPRLGLLDENGELEPHF
jgi:hypothetical protein